MTVTEEKKTQVYHSCASCGRDTWHSVLQRHVESEYEYRMDTIYQIVQCCGCHTVSFRKVVRDYESAYPIDENEWDVPEDISCFPSILKGHREPEDVWNLPDTVREIYTQSIQAIKDSSNILAGIGLRATIEAICNDRSITGRTLEKRIDSLAKGGLISQKDTERLHAIRFLGNDAAHEIKKVDARNLLIALRIIEHLLVNIYILDEEADKRLDTIIRTFEQFTTLLEKNLATCSSGEEVPLAKVFGKDMRRFHGYFTAHEQALFDAISNGTFTNLRIGKVDHFARSKDKVQHFIVP